MVKPEEMECSSTLRPLHCTKVVLVDYGHILKYVELHTHLSNLFIYCCEVCGAEKCMLDVCGKSYVHLATMRPHNCRLERCFKIKHFTCLLDMVNFHTEIFHIYYDQSYGIHGNLP